MNNYSFLHEAHLPYPGPGCGSKWYFLPSVSLWPDFNYFPTTECFLQDDGRGFLSLHAPFYRDARPGSSKRNAPNFLFSLLLSLQSLKLARGLNASFFLALGTFWSVIILFVRLCHLQC